MVRLSGGIPDFPRAKVNLHSLELAQWLWRLGSQLIVTTNYDDVLSWACEDRDHLRKWIIQNPYRQTQALRGQLVRPTIWHLHGHISEPQNLILTPDGYSRLYADQETESSNYPAALITLRQYLVSHTFLFIGFSLDDPYLGLQIRGINEIFEGATGPHYILVREPGLERVQAHINQHELPLEPVTFSNFGEPLIRCIRSLVDIVTETDKSNKKRETRLWPAIVDLKSLGNSIDSEDDQKTAPSNSYLYENIHLLSAWNFVDGQIKCKVAVLLGKTDLSHPALAGVNIQELDCTAGSDGRPDNTTTALVGLIATPHTNTSFVGIAPGAEVLAINVLDKESHTASNVDLADAIQIAVDEERARVVCIPLMSEEFDPLVDDRIQYAFENGVTIICPAGDGGHNKPIFPAALPNCITVSAVDHEDHKAPQSNFGDWVAITAPGNGFWSTKAGGGYAKVDMPGTSAACGLVALILTINPGLSPTQVAQILHTSSDSIDHLNPEFAGQLGAGRVNAFKACEQAIDLRKAYPIQ